MKPDAIKIHRLRERDVAEARAMRDVLPDLLRFIGGRPLVGYYLDFDVAMLNKHVRRFLGVDLPNPRIEMSALYYERKYGDAPPGTQVDLSFASMLDDLKLPVLDSARRLLRRADDRDGLSRAARPQGARRTHRAPALQRRPPLRSGLNLPARVDRRPARMRLGSGGRSA